jgi:hypothetical protein
MAKHTIPEAAALIQKHRSTLYRAIDAGRLSCDPDGRLDTAELLRAGYTLQTPPPGPDATTRRDRTRQDSAATQQDATTRHDTTRHEMMSAIDVENAALRRECELLQQQLNATRDMLQQQLDATRDYREQIRYLSRMLQEERQRYDRLLEAPRPTPPAQASRSSTRTPSAATLPATWQRILGYMREQALGLDSTPRHQMARMCTAGVLRRVQQGVYAVIAVEEAP